MAMSGNTNGKLCQLKLYDMDCHMYYDMRFDASFISTQFNVPSIILKIIR